MSSSTSKERHVLNLTKLMLRSLVLTKTHISFVPIESLRPHSSLFVPGHTRGIHRAHDRGHRRPRSDAGSGKRSVLKILMRSVLKILRHCVRNKIAKTF